VGTYAKGDHELESTAVDLDVANALEEGGALKTWQPGTDGNIHGNNSVVIAI
jgi:hypothetical protein